MISGTEWIGSLAASSYATSRNGTARQHWLGRPSHGWAGPGLARQLRQGDARQGTARSGMARQPRLGAQGRGTPCLGSARIGKARQACLGRSRPVVTGHGTAVANVH